MHNLLLCENGKMFHVDFGYILGRDPKPFAPPPMKLTSEMVNGMGGLHRFVCTGPALLKVCSNEKKRSGTNQNFPSNKRAICINRYRD